MRERSAAAAAQPAVRQRVAGALQRVLDTLIANLETKARAYKNKVSNSKALTRAALAYHPCALRYTRFRT